MSIVISMDDDSGAVRTTVQAFVDGVHVARGRCHFSRGGWRRPRSTWTGSVSQWMEAKSGDGPGSKKKKKRTRGDTVLIMAPGDPGSMPRDAVVQVPVRMVKAMTHRCEKRAFGNLGPAVRPVCCLRASSGGKGGGGLP